MALHHSSKIIIVGSGVFGVSTALWLARAGYSDVTVFDMQDTASACYDPATVDSASADLNKIIRFSYGSEIDYQRLAMEAAGMWEEWNQELAGMTAAEVDQLPACLRGDARNRKLWWNSGMLRMSAKEDLGDFELQTLENMAKDGLREMQFRTDDENDIARAKEQSWGHKLDPCHRNERFGVHKAVLDATAGYVVAYKSCAWAQYLAGKAGVKFVLDPIKGKVASVGRRLDGSKRPNTTTADGQVHEADLVIVAGGGWTPSLLPEATGLLETTAGSISTIQLPEARTDLWDKFAPENMPVLTWGMSQGKGIYALPRTDDGAVKVAYRGLKWTNFADVNGQIISTPKTAHVTAEKESRIPTTALSMIKEFISTHLPELAELGISATKLCWYTDSIDNSFVVDYVPGRPGVAVCSGGSGHGFKFLPILGREVVRILEHPEDAGVYRSLWTWRQGLPGATKNGLEEGEAGPRVLAKQQMATEADWSFH